ncbi:helix-turn-helix domain-containing protein [Bradyrhizobium sp. 61]|uniref:helix-turn-helix domain-containing protein n=1 Tax=unclassified Bradyrhizobium TaxID=2631580 RepID=UPI001FF9EF02|nr:MULTISPECIES: helix-turn-helix domain-containing protein [unclassified Bradyrhizobium]MCK1276269.1 helix-turn-helix domain-containing protein [Bradyrhizobium sp. 61]MCK1446214.1 helix-turn-helix domain-containing protein [Bradyrhizobium sp. 48]MCK1461315.1 helix-turn-helix domain-containing protein [Bradyrhizobium sp. 2]
MTDDRTTTGPNEAAGSMGDAAPASSLLPAFGFTADQMETHANVAAWREAVATLFDVDELAADEPGPFRADIRSFAMGPVLIGLSRASGQRFLRTPETIARSGVDHIILQLYVKGSFDGIAGARPIRVRAGDICLFDLAQTLATKATAFENVTLVVPRPMFGARLLRIEDLHGLVLPESGVIARLLAGHLTALLEFAPCMTLDECQSVVEGTVSLLAACLRNELERVEDDADHSALASPSLIRIRQHIEVGLAQRDMSAISVAAHFGLSRASLYRLFAPVGGIADYIRSRRLHRAFFDLANSDARSLRISEVARRWQLGTDAHFTRSFKAAYGITPRAAREAALLGVQRGTDGASNTTISRWMREIAPPGTAD